MQACCGISVTLVGMCTYNNNNNIYSLLLYNDPFYGYFDHSFTCKQYLMEMDKPLIFLDHMP